MADIAESAPPDTSPLRSQAIDRSLDGARARAEQRVQRFLDATTELIVERGGLEFTVQDVVERSTQSLRSFYQFFDGKQHLLLAVYEDAIRAAAEEIGASCREIDDPMERLHRSVLTVYEWSEREPAAATPSPHLTVRSMAAFIFELMATDRDAVVAATEPLFAHFADVLEQAVAAGRAQVDDLRTDAAYLMQTTMFNAFGSSAGDPAGRAGRAEALWQRLLHGLAAD